MRKVIAIVAMATLAACGGASTTTPTTDSTAVKTDSTVVATDSTTTDSVVAKKEAPEAVK